MQIPVAMKFGRVAESVLVDVTGIDATTAMMRSHDPGTEEAPQPIGRKVLMPTESARVPTNLAVANLVSLVSNLSPILLARTTTGSFN